MKRWLGVGRDALVSLGGAVPLAAAMTALGPGGFTLAGLAGAGVLLWAALFGLLVLWRWTGGRRMLAWMIGLAFCLRLGLGIGLSLALPVFGHDNEVSKAGYIFFDAYTRDQQAWALAESGRPVLAAFRENFSGDQYGGMLAASAAVYRLFSPDAHRPWLILILTAFASAAGTAFLYRAVQQRYGERTALLAGWVYGLYPESILLGGAQMRDPILIGLSAVMVYLVFSWRNLRWRGVLFSVITLLAMAAFSWLVAVPVAGVLAVWWWIDFSAGIQNQRLRTAGWALVGLAGVIAVVLMGAWLRETALWDARLTEQGSGKLQALFRSLPDPLEIPFLVVYGLAQPVLPAALMDASLPLANGIATFRSVGWYLLMPLLFYMPFALRKLSAGMERRQMSWVLIAFAGWALISSFRAGGDLWDNPRYRTLLIPWLAVCAAWSWNYAQAHKDAWLSRWYGCAGIFLAVFGLWYADRSYQLGLNLPLGGVVAAIVVMCGLLLGGGWMTDQVKRVRASGGSGTKIDPIYTVKTLRWLLGILAGVAAASLLLPLAYLGADEPWFEVLAMRHRAIPILTIGFALGLLGLSYTRGWRTLAIVVERALFWLQHRSKLPIAGIMLLSLALPAIQLIPSAVKIRPYLPPLLVFGASVVVGTALWWSTRPAKVARMALAGITVFYTLVYLVALQFARVTDYPFSLDWSEGSRFYEAAQVYALLVFGESLPLPLLDFGRGLLQGIPFLIPGLPVAVHRLWLVSLELGMAFLAVWLLVRRLKIEDRTLRWVVLGWGILFLAQGPILFHLYLPVILVLWRFDSDRPWKSLIWVGLASVWAGMTRVNWFPAPGFLAAMLYLIEQPVGKQRLGRYLLPPLVYGLAGPLIAILTYLGYTRLSGNPSEDFGTSFTSPILWERLWPNPTNGLGILGGIALVSLPLAAMVAAHLVRNRAGWHPLRIAVIGVIQVVFLAGGVIVSLKIGGGNNLHNLDIYLVLLLCSAALLLARQFKPDSPRLVQPVRFVPLWLAILVLIPMANALAVALPKPLPDAGFTRASLEYIQRAVRRTQDRGEAVLWIGERQLGIFKQVADARVSGPYERVVLAEMAMAGRRAILDDFYQDLAQQKYGLIMMEPLKLEYQDPDMVAFAQENNLFVDLIHRPVFEYYQLDRTLQDAGISILVPRR